MTQTIDLYRGPAREPFGPIPLIDLLRASMLDILGVGLGSARVLLALLPVPDDDPPGGPPAVHNLTPEYGYARVTVHDGERVLYQHPHTVEELIARPLRLALAEAHPGETEWAFAFSGLELTARVTIPEPAVEGAAPVVPYAEGEQAPFRIRRLPDTVPPGRLADFGIDAGAAAGAAVKVLIAPAVREELLRGRDLSSEVEEGGFLLGHVFADQDAPGTHIVQVTAAPAAEHTGASLLHLTFTGDSFDAVKRRLRAGGTERLVGWFHTHLFAAAEEMGLSTIDLRLHFTTFKLPWQLAGLVNLDGRRRVLRFYVRRGDDMDLCPQWAQE